jgi:hypothetical protein
MGGGALMTPILIILFGFKPTLAVGTDILHGAVFKTFGAFRHRRLGTVHARLTFWEFLGSAPFSLLGGLGLFAKTFIRRGVRPDDAPFLLERRDRMATSTSRRWAGRSSARFPACSSEAASRSGCRSGSFGSDSPACSCSVASSSSTDRAATRSWSSPSRPARPPD